MFEHHLARELGMTVARLRQEMPAEEFGRWSHFFRWEARERRWQQQRAQAAARRRSGQGGPAHRTGAGAGGGGA